MLAEKFDLYEGRDPRDVPAYSFREVALSIDVPVSTLRAWCAGQSNFAHVLSLPEDWTEYHALSFFNLIEANVVAELRREHKVPMRRVRTALEFLAENVPVPHPLVEKELLVTPNQRVYIVHEGKRIDISAGGQWPLDAVVRNLLRRVHRGRHGILAFFPRVRPPKQNSLPEEEYAPVVVDPEVCFGRPLIAGTAIPTDVVADRYLGGDSIKKMSEDYDLSEEQIEAALRFERLLKADAA
ncbi:MAG TPA: DUF433 domain-containing protein [Thermoanaerobaculia bacterium]|nr:DUF433 domain-containing protein [Thermoanaerobaculia bacterium]